MTDKCPLQFDLMNPRSYAAGMPLAQFAELRRQCPVSWQEASARHGGDFWAITRREDLDFVSKNPALFSSSERLAHPQPGGEDPAALEIMRQMLINMDPPGHIKYRRVVRNAFTARAVDALEPMMREHARRIVDAVAPRGECEFAREVAAELPLLVICALMEMPAEKRQRFSTLVNTMIGIDDPELGLGPADGQLAAAEIFGIAMELATEHKSNPKGGTVIDALLNGAVEGEALSEFEFCTFFLILITAAVETTRTATSHGMRLLMAHPQQLQLLVDEPALIPDAVEEILRFHPPIIHMQRTATQDLLLGGMQIRKGDVLKLFYPSANHEEEVFGADAASFDVLRAQRMPELRNQHRTFGVGQHFCLGSHLARKQLCVMFGEIVPRLRNPRPAAEPRNMVSNFVSAVKEMPIRFDPEQKAAGAAR